MSEKMLTNKLNKNEAVVCVVGLGYVGLPLAKNFSFKLSKSLIKKLRGKKPLLKTKKQKEVKGEIEGRYIDTD